MTLGKFFATALFATSLAIPTAFADFPAPGFGHPGAPGFGHPGSPGFGGPGHGGDRGDRGDRHDDHGRGPGWGHGGPGFGPRGPMPGWWHGSRPGWGWGRPGWGPHMPVPPPPPPPQFHPAPSSGLCQGNFSGQLENGRNVMISLNGNGMYVTAAVMMDNPDEQLTGQGTCQDVQGGAQLSLTLNSGVVATAQIYVASDNQVYIDGTESNDNQRFILQRQ